MTNYVHVVSSPSIEVFGLDSITLSAIIAGGTLVIAVVSFFLSYRTAKAQGQLVRHQVNHDHLSVTPVLNFSLDLALVSLSEYLGISITNSGMGPAAIRPPLVFLDDEPVGFLTGEDVTKLREHLGVPRSVNIFLIGGGKIISVGETLRLFWFSQSNLEGVRWAKRFHSRINIIVSYSSLYEHQYMIIGMNNPVNLVEKYRELVPDYKKPFVTQDAL